MPQPSDDDVVKQIRELEARVDELLEKVKVLQEAVARMYEYQRRRERVL